MATSPLLSDAVREFERAQIQSNVAAGTVRSYRHVLKRLATRFQGRRVGGITTEDVGDFLYGPAGILVGLGVKTGTSYRSALRSFFQYARMRGWTRTVIDVPMPVFRSRKAQPKGAPPVTRLSEAELLLMLERADHPMVRGIVAVGISTALRISDILKLRCQDVNFTTGELYVWVKKTGRYDAMPITLDLEEEMRRYLIWYTEETGLTLESEGHLFPGWQRRNSEGTGFVYYVPNPAKECSYAWAADRLKPLYEDCGIRVEKQEAWHVIRRSVARIYFDKLREDISYDHALRQTSALLGHLNSQTTERYLGLDVERQARNLSLRGKRFIGDSSDLGVVTDIRRRPAR